MLGQDVWIETSMPAPTPPVIHKNPRRPKESRRDLEEPKNRHKVPRMNNRKMWKMT